jgi:diadenylate cyclase
MQQLLGLLRNFGLNDALDIIVMTTLFFFILSLLRETRSSVALRGLVALILFSFGGYVLAKLLNLSGVAYIFGNFWIIIVLIFLIVFQNDFKKALTDLGQMRIFRAIFKQSGEYIEELVKAVEVMSVRKIGALIAIERRNPLKVYVGTGTPVDATITSELIRTIFTNLTPLHDGAMIIKSNRIVAAGCILPLTDSPDMSKELGTRHRAAVGLSEETDAVIVVVSEETGTISLAVNGRLQRGQTPDKIRDHLGKLLNVIPEEKVKHATT